jgi:hypothetical protein
LHRDVESRQIPAADPDPDPYQTLLETQVTDTEFASDLAADLDKVDGVMTAFDTALVSVDPSSMA